MTRQGIRGALVVVLPAWVTARLLVGMGWLVAELLADGATDDLVPCCARVEAALVVARANGSLAYEDGARDGVEDSSGAPFRQVVLSLIHI